MNTNEKTGSPNSQKEKIRQKYRGISFDELDVIPAAPQKNFFECTNEKRVAVYARVSTDDPRQTSSYELQKNHYQDVINRHPGWKLTEIYADEGISGTSLQHRNAFIRMIDDCHSGKIDLIITKSVSRFARNILDCIGFVRQLAALNPPVGIFFETENIYTLDSKSEMNLSFISTLAQEESHNKSEIMNASIEMRFRRGIFLTPPLLGYDQDEDGNLIINEEEAQTVRLIFFMYLYGYTCQEIARTLTDLGRKTKLNNTAWSAHTVLQQLQNERHCGDILARKTWTPNYLDHKSRKNRKDRNQYLQKGHHEAIVSRDDFIAVQRLIGNAKYGNKGILPELHVITSGILFGFVTIHPRWAGFQASDYIQASASVCSRQPTKFPPEFQPKTGDFDLGSFEIARGEFFHTTRRISVTFSTGSLRFSAECIRKFESEHVEMLIHPGRMLLAVRPSSKDKRTSVQWSKSKDSRNYPRKISGAAFLPKLFDLLHWDYKYKYRILGFKKQKDRDTLILFHLRDTEIIIPNTLPEPNKETLPTDLPSAENIHSSAKNSLFAYPKSWLDNFGDSYCRHAQIKELSVLEGEDWKSQSPGIPYRPEPALQVTSTEELRRNITTIINCMKQEAYHE